MKLYKYIALASVALFAAACTEDALDDLSGKYPAPAATTYTAATDNGVTKDGTKRIFDVTFTGTAGETLNMKFVGDAYFLHAAAFTPADASVAKKGNYITGAGGSTYNSQAITDGVATIAKDGDNYTISGTLWLADGSAIRLGGGGTLVYEADPEAVALTKVLSFTDNRANGTNSLSIQLATAGVETYFDPATYQTAYLGSGNYLAVDFYSADGTLAPGTYSPAADASAEFTYVKGWDPGDLWGIGMFFTNWGTCWWTVDEGITSAVHIESGDITVKKSGNVYTISYNQDGIFFEFKGEIPQLNQGGDEPGPGVEYIELSNCFVAQNNVANGGNSVTLKIADANINPTYVAEAWSWTYTGNGNYLSLDIYSADGTLADGTYTAAANDALGAGNFAIGYDTEMWGMPMLNWGSCWFTVTDGQEAGQHIEDGTVTVTKSGSEYVITLESTVANARYTGAVNFQ